MLEKLVDTPCIRGCDLAPLRLGLLLDIIRGVVQHIEVQKVSKCLDTPVWPCMAVNTKCLPVASILSDKLSMPLRLLPLLYVADPGPDRSVF